MPQKRRKRLLLVIFSLLVGLAQGLNLLGTHPALIFSTQMVSAVAGSSMGPLLVCLTLGIAAPSPPPPPPSSPPRPTSRWLRHGRRRTSTAAAAAVADHSFHGLNGRVQAANHAGIMVSAGLAAGLGTRFGLRSVFWLVLVSCFLAAASVLLLLPERAIDHAAARGAPVPPPPSPSAAAARPAPPPGEDPPSPPPSASVAALLFGNRPLLVIGTTVFFFHLGNAALLPLYGQALVAAGVADPAGTTGLTVLIAQAVMIPVSVLTAWWAQGGSDYWPLLASYVVLPVRAGIAGLLSRRGWGVWPVQVLDGLGAGMQGVAVQGAVSTLMRGTGRVNVALGVAGGISRGTGAAVSALLAGWVAESRGYASALYLLGLFPFVSQVLWLWQGKTMRPALSLGPARGPEEDEMGEGRRGMGEPRP